MNFGEALEHLKANGSGAKVTRSDWYGTAAKPVVMLQRPDTLSKMTAPYLYMSKNEGEDVFPLDLSCESILSDKWEIVD